MKTQLTKLKSLDGSNGIHRKQEKFLQRFLSRFGNALAH